MIFYADFIPTQSQEPELEIQFNVKRRHTVGNIKPVAVKVYDYYNPSESQACIFASILEEPVKDVFKL